MAHDGLGLGEQLDDAAHLLLRVDKPVARDNESGMDGQRMVAVGQLAGLRQQTGVGLEAGGHALHLAVLGGVVDGCAAIHIVVAQLGAHHHILNVDVVAVAAGTSRRYYHVGVMFEDEFLCSQRRIDSSYAALDEDNLFVFK